MLSCLFCCSRGPGISGPGLAVSPVHRCRLSGAAGLRGLHPGQRGEAALPGAGSSWGWVNNDSLALLWLMMGRREPEIFTRLVPSYLFHISIVFSGKQPICYFLLRVVLSGQASADLAPGHTW